MRTSMETFTNTQGEEVKKEKYNHLAMAEMSKDVNYNKIDGIVGNNAQVSELEKKLKEAQERTKKQQKDRKDKQNERSDVRQHRRHRAQRHNRDRRNQER